MYTPSSHINCRSHHEFNLWDPPFMCEDGVCIYGTPEVYNNFPWIGYRIVLKMSVAAINIAL